MKKGEVERWRMEDSGTKRLKDRHAALIYIHGRIGYRVILIKIENNTELKKKAYEEFKMKEKYNIEFDQDKVFCYGCKPKDKPLSINVSACTVRKCVTEKGYDCCIECNGLTSCDKELWKSFPQFKEKVIDMQKRHQSA